MNRRRRRLRRANLIRRSSFITVFTTLAIFLCVCCQVGTSFQIHRATKNDYRTFGKGGRIKPTPGTLAAPPIHQVPHRTTRSTSTTTTKSSGHNYYQKSSSRPITTALSMIPGNIPDHEIISSSLSTLHDVWITAASAAAATTTEPSTTSSVAATAATSADAAFDALGHDIFVFLTASVIVVPLCKYLNISSVLGFLAVGCLIGPYGMELFSNTEGDIQLGDLGILFLLFNEGLALSPDRIKELGRFTGLGVFQLLISIGIIFVGVFWGGPVILNQAQQAGLPLDFKLIKPVVDNPIESFVIAAAGALSSSAFVLPVLKQKDWEEKPEGISGLSILLLQDLAVAPLLVIIPLLAGSGPQSSLELTVLILKATIGFGAVLAAGSIILRYVFDVVAATRSTETFVAAALLVAAGMGQTADYLGLSASTGAFAAGVLLAGNKYRAQISADIKPFEGILLGIFFITAGAELDPSIVVNEWPILLAGIASFVFIKAAIIFSSGPSLGLTKGQAARVALTLAGGGEFSLVLFQLAQDEGILPLKLTKLLIASVIISMSLTPLLGELASWSGNVLDASSSSEPGTMDADLFDQIDTDRSGSISSEELRDVLLKLKYSYSSIAEIFANFDTDGNGVIDREEWKQGVGSGLLAEVLSKDSNEALQTDETFTDDALVVLGYGEVGKSILNLFLNSRAHGRGKVVCLDNNPSRVTSGVLEGEPVVFGDGAKIELLKAIGVTKPEAVIITLASESLRIDATMRLRSCLPDNTPIYVFKGMSKDIGLELVDAGATEVICQTTETILRLGCLLGACQSEEDLSRIRKSSMNVPTTTSKIGLTNRAPGGLESTDTVGIRPAGLVSIAGLSEEATMDLADEIGISIRELIQTWEDFDSVARNRDTVPISELKSMMMRSSSEGPSDGTGYEYCLSQEDEDGVGELTFDEYAKAVWIDCVLDLSKI